MKVYVDFDNTLVDSVSAFISRYNSLYNKKVKSETITSYSFDDIKLSSDEVSRGFHSNFFFSELKLYPEALKSLTRMKQEGAELILITRGDAKNLAMKLEWLEKNHVVKDLFSDMIFTTNDMRNIKVDMTDGILIDDLRVNHLNSNARYKYAYKDAECRKWFPIPDDGVKIYSSWGMIADEICLMLQPTEVKEAKQQQKKKPGKKIHHKSNNSSRNIPNKKS